MEQTLLFIFLSLFPFGQIIRIGVVNPIDIIVGIGALWAIFKKYKKPLAFRYFINFLVIATFTYLVSIFIFRTNLVIVGLFYLLRLAAYFYFFVFVYHFAKKRLLINSLLVISVASAIFGWVQYFFYPDVRALVEYGWDDHLFRMVGTFLDPAFLGFILVLGLIIALFKKKNLISFFLLISIAFTYSRASYLAALIPLFQKKTWALLLLFVAIVLLLPRPEGEGVKLERTRSISSRLENYQETFSVFKKFPLFGVGYNNICLAKDKDFSSHSCSGSESSLLFILAVTGILGVISFLYFGINIWRLSNPIFKTSAISLLVHSLFANSMFYPAIMGYMIILLGSALRRKTED